MAFCNTGLDNTTAKLSLVPSGYFHILILSGIIYMNKRYIFFLSRKKMAQHLWKYEALSISQKRLHKKRNNECCKSTRGIPKDIDLSYKSTDF